jgi:hypothetical protein
MKGDCGEAVEEAQGRAISLVDARLPTDYTYKEHLIDKRIRAVW